MTTHNFHKTQSIHSLDKGTSSPVCLPSAKPRVKDALMLLAENLYEEFPGIEQEPYKADGSKNLMV